MLRNMDNIRTNWSDDDDRSMVATRRLAQILNDQGTPASVGRGEFNAPEVRLQCRSCGEWFTPSFDLPRPYVCDACY